MGRWGRVLAVSCWGSYTVVFLLLAWWCGDRQPAVRPITALVPGPTASRRSTAGARGALFGVRSAHTPDASSGLRPFPIHDRLSPRSWSLFIDGLGASVLVCRELSCLVVVVWIVLVMCWVVLTLGGR